MTAQTKDDGPTKWEWMWVLFMAAYITINAWVYGHEEAFYKREAKIAQADWLTTLQMAQR